MPTYNGSEGGQIEPEVAASYTQNYRQSIAGKEGVAKAHFFGRDILQAILEQEGCMGIRIYYGIDENGQKQLVLVGANADGEDMEDGVMADFSHVCPPDCVASILNG
ncbi:hypothetical protein [Pontibacter mangrovi]|uniref:Uncharacterized protein n=1 Tax=Pontibacter mangrovi TaxID=2589816 RepID=A0A501W7T4_9BACT|nr:hypothetical protein [Pontibacter mangrovi]TPE44390.1 hypothetical protein FJM65_09580 [Pontibacter mangrovi]